MYYNRCNIYPNNLWQVSTPARPTCPSQWSPTTPRWPPQWLPSCSTPPANTDRGEPARATLLLVLLNTPSPSTSLPPTLLLLHPHTLLHSLLTPAARRGTSRPGSEGFNCSLVYIYLSIYIHYLSYYIILFPPPPPIYLIYSHILSAYFKMCKMCVEWSNLQKKKKKKCKEIFFQNLSPYPRRATHPKVRLYQVMTNLLKGIFFFPKLLRIMPKV